MDYLDRVISIMESYRHLGERVLDNGTRLIGRVPHVAPEARLQLVFAPLTAADIAIVEEEIGMTVPGVFSEFLQRCNGIRLFSDRLNIDGLRRSFARSGDAVWQPFSIRTPNVDERPRGALDTFFFVGGYGADGSRLYIDSSDMRVYRCKQRDAKALNEWPSFQVMLQSEAERLATLFDHEGRRIDSSQPTTP
jgi:hypothetical protein